MHIIYEYLIKYQMEILRLSVILRNRETQTFEILHRFYVKAVERALRKEFNSLPKRDQNLNFWTAITQKNH